MKRIGKKFWATLVIFGLMGQVAWVVENMYFNVFIYKMFHASASDISLMVGASAVAATLTTWLIGALSDKVGKRKIFICGGYILWGISILSFAFIRLDILTPLAGSTTAAAALGVTLVIVMDCVMTFFGSSANDASFNAWVTDMGDESNRGKIEGINSMMPLVAILVVFGGFMAFDLDQASSWITIFLVIGIGVIIIGVLGFFLIEDHVVKTEATSNYLKNILYSFRPSVVRRNKLLYAVVGAFAIFGISIQIFMPYLILYYEKSLGMANYVLIMAPAIVLAALITSLYGKLYDRLGFQKSVVLTILILLLGYVFLYFSRGTVPVFIGSLLMMTGYLTGMAMFGAMIRDHMPEDKVGLFQGLRIFGQVFIPGIVGPAIGARVLRNAEVIVNSDGTTSFLPNPNIFLAAFVAGVLVLVGLGMIFAMIRNGHYDLKPKDRKMGWNQRHPRPQFCRESYLSLNGEWDMNGQKVLVPYPLQSRLSGYHGTVPKHMTYRRCFQLPAGFLRTSGDHVILHLDAVDQLATVAINGREVGHHEGGYLPFMIDITEYIHRDENNELMVYATDTLSKRYPYGKQTKKRGGMWYTPVSGIWKSVWLERISEQYIENFKITPNLQGIDLEIYTNAEECKITIYEPQIRMEIDEGMGIDKTSDYGNILLTKTFVAANHEGNNESDNPRQVRGRIELDQLKLSNDRIHKAKLWRPEKPYLYHMTMQCADDKVETYFALRTMTIEQRGEHSYLCLNGKPIFLNGVLDQGYYCDGIFLPANEREYGRDILRMKELGFNVLRKHIKIEPECFYYDCDRMGMLVMQDMVNSGHYSFIRDTALPTLGMMKYNDTRKAVDSKRKEIFKRDMKSTMNLLYNHPSVVGYTIFNEGWGQFDSDDMYDFAVDIDHTRFIDSTSGWFAQKKSDVDSLHIYFRTEELHPLQRPMLVSECGGYTRLIPEHYYSKYATFGYGGYEDEEALTEAIIEMYEKMILPSIADGLCGCIYTQLSDVEDEINGIYTYDRRICKVNKERMAELNQRIKRSVDIL